MVSGPGKEFYASYHDTEWGVPVHDDQHLFEMLILEGAQAGLSWETVLTKKRDGYRKAFHQFDPIQVASMSDEELEALRTNPEIIRNRLKIFATRQNAQVFLKIQKNSALLIIIFGPLSIIRQFTIAGTNSGTSPLQLQKVWLFPKI